MSITTKITMDNVEYDVRVKFSSMNRSFEIVEGQNSGTSITGSTIRDILGTGYSYQMEVEPNPANPTDYDSFFYAISAPVDSHHVVLPFGQTVLEFDAMVTSGSDTYNGKLGSYDRWGGLTVNFTPITLQR